MSGGGGGGDQLQEKWKRTKKKEKKNEKRKEKRSPSGQATVAKFIHSVPPPTAGRRLHLSLLGCSPFPNSEIRSLCRYFF